MAGSISGLVSGLDTATIVRQLMELEAAPQNRLKVRQSTENSALSALQSLNTAVAALRTQAETLAKPATWQTFQSASSNSAVSVAADSGATPGSFTVTVDRVARSHQLGFGQAAALDEVVASTSTVRVTGDDGTAHDLDTGGGTLQEIVTAINGSTADTGVRATAVRVSDGDYRLLVQATTTGESSRFTLTLGDGSELLGGATVQQGEDAQLSLGVGITATSSTNTFADLVPGVTLTLDPGAEAGSTATVNVTHDTGAVRDSVKSLVDKVNALLTGLDTQTKASSGVLSHESTARALRSDLLETIFGDGTTTLADVGLQTDRYGKLVFDEAAFDKAAAADPAAVAARFTTGTADGWAARVAAVAQGASHSVDGTITGAITSRQTSIDRIQDSVDAWDIRLELRQQTLSRQYTALETALSTLTSQGDWLASQVAALSSSPDS